MEIEIYETNTGYEKYEFPELLNIKHTYQLVTLLIYTVNIYLQEEK